MNREDRDEPAESEPGAGDLVELAKDGKREYAAPKLTVHGTIEQITGNVGTGFLDFPQGSSIAG